MYYINPVSDFAEEIEIGSDLYTTFQGKELVLKQVYRYYGPVTMQSLPYGGVQSVYQDQLIIYTKSGFIATQNVIYDAIEMSSKDFISKFPDIVNEGFPS